MALSKNLTPMQQKPFEQWSKEDMIRINPGGNENYIIYVTGPDLFALRRASVLV